MSNLKTLLCNIKKHQLDMAMTGGQARKLIETESILREVLNLLGSADIVIEQLTKHPILDCLDEDDALIIELDVYAQHLEGLVKK